MDVLDLANVDMEALEYGKVSAMAGSAAFYSVKKVIELAMQKEVHGTVTGPLNKEAMKMAGFNFAGHTEIYAHFTDTKNYTMLLVEENLRVVHVSTHVSLRQACDLVKKERILETIKLAKVQGLGLPGLILIQVKTVCLAGRKRRKYYQL